MKGAWFQTQPKKVSVLILTFSQKKLGLGRQAVFGGGFRSSKKPKKETTYSKKNKKQLFQTGTSSAGSSNPPDAQLWVGCLLA